VLSFFWGDPTTYDSADAINRVPITTPSAPRASAAASPRVGATGLRFGIPLKEQNLRPFVPYRYSPLHRGRDSWHRRKSI